MPFMVGRAPIRRTKKYLEKGRLVFKDMVKVVTINYNIKGKDHEGARDFVFWYLPQIMYKNPDVQIIGLKNMTPTPFIRTWLDSGEEVLMDIDSKNKDEILSHLTKILGKSEKSLTEEAMQKEKKDNPANFGRGCDRHCICEIPGQVPCPAVVPLPKFMRGKFRGFKENSV